MRTNGSARTVWNIVKIAAKRYEIACHLKGFLKIFNGIMCDDKRIRYEPLCRGDLKPKFSNGYIQSGRTSFST